MFTLFPKLDGPNKHKLKVTGNNEQVTGTWSHVIEFEKKTCLFY